MVLLESEQVDWRRGGGGRSAPPDPGREPGTWPSPVEPAGHRPPGVCPGPAAVGGRPRTAQGARQARAGPPPPLASPRLASAPAARKRAPVCPVTWARAGRAGTPRPPSVWRGSGLRFRSRNVGLGRPRPGARVLQPRRGGERGFSFPWPSLLRNRGGPACGSGAAGARRGPLPGQPVAGRHGERGAERRCGGLQPRPGSLSLAVPDRAHQTLSEVQDVGERFHNAEEM